MSTYTKNQQTLIPETIQALSLSKNEHRRPSTNYPHHCRKKEREHKKRTAFNTIICSKFGKHYTTLKTKTLKEQISLKHTRRVQNFVMQHMKARKNQKANNIERQNHTVL